MGPALFLWCCKIWTKFGGRLAWLGWQGFDWCPHLICNWSKFWWVYCIGRISIFIGLLRRFWSNYVDPAAINLCIGCTLHQTLENPRWIHVCENRGFRSYHYPAATMWVFRDSYVAHEFCVRFPIVSRVRVLVMRDSYVSLHSPGLRMLKRWGKRDLGVKEQRKQKEEEDELLYFAIQSLWELQPRFKPWVSLGWAGEADPWQFWQHICIVYHISLLLLLFVFFLCILQGW